LFRSTSAKRLLVGYELEHLHMHVRKISKASLIIILIPRSLHAKVRIT
jgi:hypothetical protein